MNINSKRQMAMHLTQNFNSRCIIDPCFNKCKTGDCYRVADENATSLVNNQEQTNGSFAHIKTLQNFRQKIKMDKPNQFSVCPF